MAFVTNKNARNLARKHRRYLKSIERLSKSSVPKSAELAAEIALFDLISTLKSDEISQRINSALAELPEDVIRQQHDKFDTDSSEFKQELQIAGDLGVSKSNFFKRFDIVSTDEIGKVNQYSINSVSELVEVLKRNHEDLVLGFRTARSLSKNDKRLAKRQLLKITSKVVIGTGCLGLNTFTFTMPMSYFIALSFYYGAAENAVDTI